MRTCPKVVTLLLSLLLVACRDSLSPAGVTRPPARPRADEYSGGSGECLSRPLRAPLAMLKATSGFGIRYATDGSGRLKHHSGIDLEASRGTPVYAADGGVVAFTGWANGKGGQYVTIEHGEDRSTQYMHLSAILVSRGQSVNAGDVIALSGNTDKRGGKGNTVPAHLHFVYRVGRAEIDPMPCLPYEERLDVAPDSPGMEVGERRTLSATVVLGDGTPIPKRTILFGSRSPEILEVDERTGEMHALAAGIARVQVSASLNTWRDIFVVIGTQRWPLVAQLWTGVTVVPPGVFVVPEDPPGVEHWITGGYFEIRPDRTFTQYHDTHARFRGVDFSDDYFLHGRYSLASTSTFVATSTRGYWSLQNGTIVEDPRTFVLDGTISPSGTTLEIARNARYSNEPQVTP